MTAKPEMRSKWPSPVSTTAPLSMACAAIQTSFTGIGVPARRSYAPEAIGGLEGRRVKFDERTVKKLIQLCPVLVVTGAMAKAIQEFRYRRRR